MKLLRVIPFAAIGILLSACSHPGGYVPYGMYDKGPSKVGAGYEDFHVKDDVWHISYKGFYADGPGQVTQYFHRRAGEVCRENGYSTYEVISEQAATMANAGGVSAVTIPMAGGMNAVVPVSGTTSAVAQGYIKCLK